MPSISVRGYRGSKKIPWIGPQCAIDFRTLPHRVHPYSLAPVALVSLSIMRRFTFCAGHRLVGHEGKCQNLHGHNYVLEIYITGSEQDEVGRILDFKLLKQKCNAWLDANWDHTFILWSKDRNGIDAIRQSQPHRIYELDSNPTAENMAIHLLEEICPKILVGTGASAFKIRLWESEETCAEVSNV